MLDGGEVVQETRLWDPDKNRTTSMRGKEEAHDYRYFPDPDLLPLVIDEHGSTPRGQALPELPEAKKARFIEQSRSAGPMTAEVLTGQRGTGRLFRSRASAASES